MKHTKRKAFNFLRSYYDVFNDIPKDSDKLLFIKAVLDKSFLNADPLDLKFPVNLAYNSQINAIDSSVKGWIRANKTDLHGNSIDTPPTPPQGKTHSDPKEEKEKEEEKEKVQLRKGIVERKAEFKNSLHPFLEKYGSELLNDFFSYWTEHGKLDKKMRFEKQVSFSIERRLTTWHKKQIEFTKEKSSAKKEKKDAATILIERHGFTNI